MSDADFEAYLLRKGIVLNQTERVAVDLLRRSLAEHVKTLVANLTTKVGQTLLKADKQLHRQLGRKQRPGLFAETERRKALAMVAKDMAQATETSLANAMRTISTETNNAYQEGRASEILRKAGGGDPLCFKRPRHDACDACVAAYLMEDGVTPRVFRLSELIDNGSNIGKSRADRLPVIDSFHPFCVCELSWLPSGFGFDSKGQMTYVGKEKSAQ
jgi:hypothetical protein